MNVNPSGFLFLVITIAVLGYALGHWEARTAPLSKAKRRQLAHTLEHGLRTELNYRVSTPHDEELLNARCKDIKGMAVNEWPTTSMIYLALRTAHELGKRDATSKAKP